MKHNYLTLLTFALGLPSVFAQITDPKATEVWSPEPRMVTPGNGSQAPSDAIVLFDGSNWKEWVSVKGQKEVSWTLEDGVGTVKSGSGDIVTRRSFGDIQLHLEFSTPIPPSAEGQNRGNSGIFLQGRYELQVLDSYQNRTYSNGQAAAIYKQSIPLVNACRKPGEWQSYDILFTAPRFNQDSLLVSPARITVLQNGIVVQWNTEIKGPTEYIGLPVYQAHGKAPLQLQDHSCLVRYRNIWVREL